MICHQFDYLRPTEIIEALSILQDRSREARVLAGGTDLLVRLRKGMLKPQVLISLKNLPLDFIEEKKSGVEIGSATILSRLAASKLLQDKFTALWEAVRLVGATQVRNKATLGGNLCNAAPSADTAPPLLVLGASVEAVSVKDTRTIPIDKFFVGPGQTALKPNELVTLIRIPPVGSDTSTAYVKFRRTAEDIALVGVAVLLKVTPEGIVSDLKVAAGAVAPTPVRAYAAEDLARGSLISDLDTEKLSELAVSATRPIDDVRASADYRRTLVRTLTRRALALAIERNGLIRRGGDVDGT